MLDLETMGNNPEAAITAIGAVEFNSKGLVKGSEFYHPVNLLSSVELGGKMDASTVIWWMQQSDAARNELTGKGETPLIDLKTTLKMFSKYLDTKNKKSRGRIEIWGNGATFDNVILRSAYKNAGVPVPWSYKDDRCFRTLVCLFPDAAKSAGPRDLSLEHHNALDDAKYQAMVAAKILGAKDIA